ncbi:CPBP family intramembrane metalloprotease [Parafrigoribacterium mesophilum]|uniref:CPBP family intramembrane glutamic endopeptidase n=1 Tax=Parafrigoribacterium mesophilum TaxID=433646 RepID=UPI0031FE0599
MPAELSPVPQDKAAPHRRIRVEILLVLGLSLGASAVYSVVAILARLTQKTPLSSQTATLNNSLSNRPGFDLTYQLLSVLFDLVPVALAAFLLWRVTRPHLSRLGIDGSRPWRDALAGLALAVVIGVPGLALYLLGHAIGITVRVQPNALDTYWWTIPVLLLSALRAGVVEEVLVVGYLFARLGDLGWRKWPIILTSAVLRGSYHLYQGFGSFVGNVAMGVLFGWLYTKYGRVLPLVVAHFLLDAVSFVGYQWAVAALPALFA